jgi:serine/threonine protein kinase
MQPPPQAQVIAGKYRLVRQLGKGGMGSVWYAEHLTLHSPVAIKLIDPEIAQNAEALARFLREAQSAASLRSPHVVQILDHGVDNGVPYIAMEVLDGESLADRLTRIGRLMPAETARLMTHVGRAIGRAHEAGIVHRDLKPDNIFIIRNDEEEIGKVLDFGIAKSTAHGLGASSGGATRTGALLGTPYYMRPEQAEGARTLDHRTDIWAMGVIAFECIVGRRPFDAEALGGLLLAICTRPIPVPSQWNSVPAGFDAWFARACARDLNARFATAKEAATDLRRVCEGADGHAGAVSQQSGFGINTAGAVGALSTGPSASGRSVPGFAATTGQLSTSEVSFLVPRKSKAPFVILGIVLLGAVAGGVALMKMGASTDSVSSAEIPSSVAPPAAADAPRVVPAAEPVPPLPTPIVEPAPSAAPSAAPTPAPKAATPVPARKTAKAPAKPAEAPKPAAPAPPPAPPPTAAAKPKVNLGI